ncbi:MAG: DUF6754 domain-containing protein, partial [Planctomycetota bacterium]
MTLIKNFRVFLVVVFLFVFSYNINLYPQASSAPAVTFISPEDYKVFDTPNDSKGNISISWKKMSSDSAAVTYYVSISNESEGQFITATSFPSNTRYKTDKKWPFWVSGKKEGYHYLEINPLGVFKERKKKLQEINKKNEKIGKESNDYKELESEISALQKEIILLEGIPPRPEAEIKESVYYFKLKIVSDNQSIIFPQVLSGQAKNNWFNFALLNNLIVVILFCAVILWYISHAKKNKNIFLRHITGLDAVEEAVGRATEMGRSVFYLTGIGGMSDISTICATVILGKVSEKIAQYDTQIMVPHRDPIVMTVCQETVKEAYTKSGRPDAYKEDCNFYVTGDQFAYTAAVNGMMMREKPAANFFMGSYMAEALLLSECGASTGAIQIAGSDSISQLPFFIT